MDAWEIAAGEAFADVQRLAKLVPGYSYAALEEAVRTDEHLCRFLGNSLRVTKNLLLSTSDLLFSLQLGAGLLDSLQQLRNDVDLVGDAVIIHRSPRAAIAPEFYVRLIRQDTALVSQAAALNRDVEILFNGILTQTRGRGLFPQDFWKRVGTSLVTLRKELRALEVQFKERDALCALPTLALERTYRTVREEIEKKY